MSDTNLFIQLLEQNQNIIHKVCNLYADDASDREDLFQEITLQAWKGFKKFRQDAKFSTWLYRVALNTAISHFRKEKKKRIFVPASEMPDIMEKNENNQEKLNALYKSISSLGKIDKALVMLYLEDYDYDEIGNVLGITANNVAVKMNRIKSKLKELTKLHYQFS